MLLRSFGPHPAGRHLLRLAAAPGNEKVEIAAVDKEGNHASATVQLQAREGADQILLRTQRAVYRAGDRIQLQVFSTKERGSVYLDVVKDGQTVLTRDLDIKNGHKHANACRNKTKPTGNGGYVIFGLSGGTDITHQT